MEHVYEAGYTDHAGYQVVVVAADNAGALYDAARDLYDPEFSFGASSFKQSAMLAKVAEWITDHEGRSGWVRTAPFTLCMVDKGTNQKVYTPTQSLEDMVVGIVNATPLRETCWKQCSEADQGGGLQHRIVVGSADTVLQFRARGECASASAVRGYLTVEDVVAFARNAYEGEGYVVRDITMSALSELEYASRMIRKYEEGRIRALGGVLAAGMTQRAIADVCGVSQSTVSRWAKSTDS